MSIQSNDTTQFWKLAFEDVVKKIRRDFELLYATIYREMTVYYEIRTGELQTNVKQALKYQQIESEQFAMIQQKLQIEYEKVQKSLFYEKDILIKLETTCCKKCLIFILFFKQNVFHFF